MNAGRARIARTMITRETIILFAKNLRLVSGGFGFAKTEKKKVRATALGPRRITATAGIFARLTPIMTNALSGSRNNGKSTAGRIWVPVLISQAAFITDQVQTTTAMM